MGSVLNVVDAEIAHFEETLKAMDTSMARCGVSKKEYRNCDCDLCAFERNYISDHLNRLRETQGVS